MRLSDARVRKRQTEMFYPDHQPPPWLNGDNTPRSLEPIVRHFAVSPIEIHYLLKKYIATNVAAVPTTAANRHAQIEAG
jgi:hypothetical protein